MLSTSGGSCRVAAVYSAATLFFSSKQLLCKNFTYISNPLCNSLRPTIRWSSRNSRMETSASKFATRASAQPLKNPDELIDSVETFIFDCDGVIWKGDKLIDGVPDTLDMLRSKGKRLVFVTNNSTKSRKQYGKKFENLGLNVSEEEIFASSFAAAAYLKSIDFPKDKKVYVIGEDGILKELELAGIQYLGGPEDGGKKIELKPGFMMEHDENVGAVVVGFDRYFNYYKIQYATLCIRENPGCLFIATNRDAVTHLTDAQEWAGGGSMVGAIGGSTQREPLVVGKPSTFMMDYLASKYVSKPWYRLSAYMVDFDFDLISFSKQKYAKISVLAFLPSFSRINWLRKESSWTGWSMLHLTATTLYSAKSEVWHPQVPDMHGG